MPVSKDQIYGLLQSELKSEHVEVEDHSDGCGAKFSVTVVSESFKGKTPLERHRMVNGILKDLMKEIHALSLKTLTPDQWEKRQKDE